MKLLLEPVEQKWRMPWCGWRTGRAREAMCLASATRPTCSS